MNQDKRFIGKCYYCRKDMWDSDFTVICHNKGSVTRSFHVECGMDAIRATFE